ncbi:MAG: class I SAM-dependent methyltransferase, partial [Anaerolineae bacterium]
MYPDNPWWRLVRFGFRLLYNEMAWTYDMVSTTVSLGQWQSWQRIALDYVVPEQRVLEIAHGTANLHAEILDRGLDAVGLDLSPYMGRIARRKLGNRADLVRGSAMALPFAAESFGTVITTFPTDFFLQAETLRSVHRVLIRRGRYVIIPSATLDLNGVLPRFLEWLYAITGQREGYLPDLTEPFANEGFTA